MAKTKTNNKKWHQRWWGVIIIIFLVIILIYIAVIIYQVVFQVEIQTQSRYEMLKQKFQQTFSPGTANLRETLIETKDDPYWGMEDANIVIVEFSDFQCPYCRQAYPEIKKLREAYQTQIKIIYRDMPNVSSHPQALNAALAAECADDQSMFWPYHDKLFENQTNLNYEDFKIFASELGLDMDRFNQCFDEKKYAGEIYNDVEDAYKLGISGTPTFFINGNRLQGNLPYEYFKEIIDKALSQTQTIN